MLASQTLLSAEPFGWPILEPTWKLLDKEGHIAILPLQSRRLLEKASAMLSLIQGKQLSFPSPQSGSLSCAHPLCHTLYTSSHRAEKHYSLNYNEDYPTTKCIEPSRERAAAASWPQRSPAHHPHLGPFLWPHWLTKVLGQGSRRAPDAPTHPPG